MARGWASALAGGVLLIAGISGCSSSPPGSGGGSAGGGGGPTVIIDGKSQEIAGSVSCRDAGSVVSIALAGGMTAVEAVVTKDDPPAVTSVGINYPTFTAAYPAGGSGSASASKTGNTYRITGTAAGTDQANPTEVVNKSFEIDLTCAGS